MPNPYSTDLRERVVAAYEDGQGSYVDIGKTFSVGPDTVGDWVRLFRATGRIDPKPHSGGKSTQKLFEHHYQDIEAWLDEDPNLFWRQVADKLKDEYELTITPSQLSRQMKKRGYTRKKTRT